MRSYAKKLMDTAILAGQIMLECNAESYRVEETMNYILSTSNFETCEAFAMATGIFATLDDDCIDSITEIRRVPNRDTNLNRIYKVNAISRQLVTKEIDLDTAYQRLQDLKESEYPQWLKDLGLILMCGFYAALFGATPIELVIASVAAVIMPFIYKLDPKLKLGTFRVEPPIDHSSDCHYHYDSETFRSRRSNRYLHCRINHAGRSWNRHYKCHSRYITRRLQLWGSSGN